MSAATLEACVTAIKAKIASELSYSASSIKSGRKATPNRATPWAHIRRNTDGAPDEALVGGHRAVYVFDVELYRRDGDTHEEDAIDTALQADVEALRVAWRNKGLDYWSTLTGIEESLVTIVARDDATDTEGEQRALLRLTLPFFEV